MSVFVKWFASVVIFVCRTGDTLLLFSGTTKEIAEAMEESVKAEDELVKLLGF